MAIMGPNAANLESLPCVGTQLAVHTYTVPVIPSRSGLVAACVLVLVLVSACSDSSDEPDPPDSSDQPDQPSAETPATIRVALTEVATASAPIAGTAGPDGTVWIAERDGTVRPLGEQGLGEPVLDITGETTTDGERGLLGIAFDEAFEHFYISYTDLGGHSVIDGFEVADGELRPDTRRTLLTQEQPFPNHNGGDITFGPDGMLYIGLGDGGSGGDPFANGQNLGTLLGKLLRIDPTGDSPYAIPPDNPFVADSGARGEIWAYGLRNPWRFSFDAETGDLWIGDVGQSAHEEIDFSPAGSSAGANYGWSIMEATEEYSGEDEPADHVPPVYDYETGENRCSVTGGYVYRGSSIPELVGSYVFSDYCEGDIRALELDGAGQLAGQTNLDVNGGSVVSFVQGPDRELYVLDIEGTVYRLDPAS
jgi:glucose/arabinose dehydrogenase